MRANVFHFCHASSNQLALGKKFNEYDVCNYLGDTLTCLSATQTPKEVHSYIVGDYCFSSIKSAQDYYSFGMLMPGRKYATATYRFGFNGKENVNEIDGTGNSVDFGARMYDSRLGRWMSLDPSQRKYAGNTPYNFVLNSPLQAIDPDGKDIIVLCDVDGVHGAGHQALLIGDEEHGWTYISKDGAEKSGNAFGRSRFTVQTFKNLQEFRNSPHNFDLVEGDNHSNVGGKTKAGKDMIFLLKDGKKIQRYEKAYRIYTTKIDGISTDQKSIDAAIKECKKDYQLSMSDCSDAVTSALNVAKDHTGKQVRNGENNWTVLLCFALRGVTETPVSKQANIAERNSGESCNSAIKPDNCNLSNGEKGVESKKQ